jgi:hypothetical protein
VTDQPPPVGVPPEGPSAGGGPDPGDDGARLPGARHSSGLAAPALGALASRAGAHRARTRRPLLTRLLASVLTLAVVALVTVLLLRTGTTKEPVGTAPPGRDDATWVELVRWAEAELYPHTPVLVRDDLLADVTAAGGDENRFRPLDAEVPGALLLVTTEPPPGSVVLARFGNPASTALTVVDPHPGKPTPAEFERRQRLSAAILANPYTGATGRAADVLQRADVDARLLGLLALLVAQLGVGVADFPPAPGEPADGPFARHVLLDRVGGEPAAPGEPVTDRLLAFLDAQLPPFSPDVVDVTENGVRVGFRYESAPDAVVTEKTS